MAAELITTPGASDANAYASIERFTRYLDEHPYPGNGATATNDMKRRAVILATRTLDASFIWDGGPSQDGQRLAWPRYGCTSRNGDLLDESVIPDDIEEAVCEMARQLLAGDRTADNDADASGLASLSAAGISMTFRNGAKSKPIPDMVAAMVAHLGTVRGSGFAVPLVRT